MDERYPVSAVLKYPPVRGDLTLIVDEAAPAPQVEAASRQAGGSLLASVTLFDVHRGQQIAAGKKTLAYSLTDPAPSRALTDIDVAKVQAKIIKRLQEELGGGLHG